MACRGIASLIGFLAAASAIRGQPLNPSPAHQPESFVAVHARPRRNVLIVLCDDLRWNAMSYAGHPVLKTPNIDRIATEGVRFANMFCTTSLCSPSRASILTGLYAHSHGVRDNFTELPATLAH